MPDDLASLERQIGDASGPSEGIDLAIAATLDGELESEAPLPYTASVDDCIALIKRTLPDWHWHVGHGPLGIVPYASMSENGGDTEPMLVEATAPTVPLALLRVLMKALRSRP